MHLQLLLIQFDNIINLTMSPLYFNGQKGPPSVLYMVSIQVYESVYDMVKHGTL